MLELFIANKNYSSWSLRPWLILRELEIPFAERLLRFDDRGPWAELRAISPAGKVPCLRDGAAVVWESLAIAEHLAERHPGVWPADPIARSWARSASAEMHAGFPALRGVCSMSCGIRVRLRERPAALERDLARLVALWSAGLQTFGGPWLAGPAFSAVDAFFAPVAFRAQTYGLELGAIAEGYVAHLLERPAMQAWYAAALAEPFRDAEHDEEVTRMGEVIADLRASASA